MGRTEEARRHGGGTDASAVNADRQEARKDRADQG